MQEEEWERIRRHIVFLRNNLNIDVVSLYLYQEHEISDDEEESLSVIPDKKERSVGLLRLLRTKPNGYNALKDALVHVQPDIVHYITQDPQEHTERDGNVDGTEDIPPPPYSACVFQPNTEYPPPYGALPFTPVAESPSCRRSDNFQSYQTAAVARPAATTDVHHIPDYRASPTNVSSPASSSLGRRHDTSFEENQTFPTAPASDRYGSSATAGQIPDSDVQSSNYGISHVRSITGDISNQEAASQLPHANNPPFIGPFDQTLVTPDAHEDGSLSAADQQQEDVGTQSQTNFEEIPLLVKNLYTRDLNSQRKSCRLLLLNSINPEEKRAIEKAGGIHALLRIVQFENDETLLEYATGVLWNFSASREFMETLLCDGLSFLVERAIVPFQTFSRNRFIYRNAVGVIRNISTASLDDEEKGWETRNKLREQDGLVQSVVEFLRLAVHNCVLETKATENSVYVLRNLSYRIQEVCDKDYDAKHSKEVEEFKEGMIEFFGRLFSAKGKQKKTTETPLILEISKNCQVLLDQSLLRMYVTILSNCTKSNIICAVLKALSGLTQCTWSYAAQCKENLRKEKGLPLFVESLVQEDGRIVEHAAELLQHLTTDPQNGRLIGKYGMKQLIRNLPRESSQKTSDQTICHILSILGNIFQQSSDEVQRDVNIISFVTEGGVHSLKIIKFVQGVYQQNTKNEAQTVLESLWKVHSLHSTYEANGLRKADIKAPVVIGL